MVALVPSLLIVVTILPALARPALPLEYPVAATVLTGMLADLLDFAVLIADALMSRRPRFWLRVLLVSVVAFVAIVILAAK